MSSTHFVGDAWILEAEEVSTMLAEIETKIKNKTPIQRKGLRETAGWKLLELGPKLDRLESLIHNPRAKPILTDQDLVLRQNMLSEIRLRMKSVVVDLYSIQCTSSYGSLPSTETEELTNIGSNCDQDNIRSLVTPLVQVGISSDELRRWTCKACEAMLVVLGVTMFLAVLVILVALI